MIYPHWVKLIALENPLYIAKKAVMYEILIGNLRICYQHAPAGKLMNVDKVKGAFYVPIGLHQLDSVNKANGFIIKNERWQFYEKE